MSLIRDDEQKSHLLSCYFPIIPSKSEHKNCLKQQITIKTHIKITQVQITQAILLHVHTHTQGKFYIVIFFNVLLLPKRCIKTRIQTQQELSAVYTRTHYH